MVTQTTKCVTGDAAFAVDRKGVIVLWNPAAEKTFGYPANDALQQKCWKLLCGKDTYSNKYCCKFCPLREMAFQHEAVNGFQASFKTASAGRKQFSISCVTVFDESDNGLFLHVCHPQKETVERSFNEAATKPSAKNHGVSLSRRETEVLTLLADEKSTRQMASMMGISPATVRNHIYNVLRKLRVHTRLEAVMLGKRLNMI
ncbi:MAG: PAS domain-containing protein [Proteobacteria bacterium]|nr:PAS domain-containing protein [Pseudomonadota bacterium]